MGFQPTNEIVAVAWLKTLPGVPSNGVATTLPGDSTTWQDEGFVTVTLTGGTPDIYIPQRRPVFQLDCWAVNPNSQKPPWGKANAIAEAIAAACQPHRQRQVFGTVTTPPQYDDARVQTGNLESEPRRVLADEARYADYMLELALYWVPLEAP
ncbi:hypothetical protein [Actinomadura nitritigenes]|uniref:hypothetical protein n=1 Tax=Actinomadura nitritigenes TaxID=134602 RepID=UPI003D8D0102